MEQEMKKQQARVVQQRLQPVSSFEQHPSD
jgi:hypothetical protein